MLQHISNNLSQSSIQMTKKIILQAHIFFLGVFEYKNSTNIKGDSLFIQNLTNTHLKNYVT